MLISIELRARIWYIHAVVRAGMNGTLSKGSELFLIVCSKFLSPIRACTQHTCGSLTQHDDRLLVVFDIIFARVHNFANADRRWKIWSCVHTNYANVLLQGRAYVSALRQSLIAFQRARIAALLKEVTPLMKFSTEARSNSTGRARIRIHRPGLPTYHEADFATSYSVLAVEMTYPPFRARS